MLIGRKGERATLQALADGAARGQGAALLVTGEPGMGKTVLLDEAAERAQGSLTTLRASGRESDADLPFAALAELLRPVEREIDALPGPQARALRRALGLEEGEGAVDGLSVGVATLGVLAALAMRQPVLAVVDDLQWVDEPSRATISFLARRVPRFHIALLCAAREGELPEAEFRDQPRLELVGLRAREAGELLAGSTGVPLDRAVRQRLLELSAGNPLALVELPTALSDAQLQGVDELGEPIPVNGGIERTFGARVARLPERTRRALLVVAAAGSDADESIVAAYREQGLGLTDIEPAELDRLVAVTRGGVTFRHPLVRSVVYQGESVELRRATHALLAEVEQDADRRVWHRASAAVAPDEVVAAELDTAAGRALSRGAPGSAVRAFAVAARFSAADEARATRARGTGGASSRRCRGRSSSCDCSPTVRCGPDHARRPAARGIRSPHARGRSRGRPSRAHSPCGATGRDRQAPRGDDAPPGLEAPHLPPRSSSGSGRGRACPGDASGRRARRRPSCGVEHEPHGGRQSRRSGGGSCRGGRCGTSAPRTRAHAGHRLAAGVARGVRPGARGDGSFDRRPARGRVPALSSPVALAAGGAGLPDG